jgi:hypothetical protein
MDTASRGWSTCTVTNIAGYGFIISTQDGPPAEGRIPGPPALQERGVFVGVTVYIDSRSSIRITGNDSKCGSIFLFLFLFLF